MSHASVSIIGGGLAGSEAAFQLALRGINVVLYEMRPTRMGPAHHTAALAELVCSNSFKALKGAKPSAAAMLKHEAGELGSLVLAAALATSVPAGTALAVDRERFAGLVTSILENHPRVEIRRTEAGSLPSGPVIVATGPLTSAAFEPVLTSLVSGERLSFFDAAAPIVDASTLDQDRLFPQARYDKGEGGGDYLNCPLEREEYEALIDALVDAGRVELRDFEPRDLFAACQPIEEVARTGVDAPRHGALKPVGLTDPRTGRRPWAVLQLRSENREGSAYNLVGCQTNLTFAEQRRVFRMVPALGRAEFLRYGVMHRNTFVDAPRLLTPDLALRGRPEIRFAGQITGTEGYLEAAVSGLVAALGTFASLTGGQPVLLPPQTAMGALLAHATDPGTIPYQPLHVNFGVMPPLDPPVRARADRHSAYVARGSRALSGFLRERADLRVDEAVGAAREVGE